MFHDEIVAGIDVCGRPGRQMRPLKDPARFRTLRRLAILCLVSIPVRAAEFLDFRVNPREHALALYLKDGGGQVLRHFMALDRHLAARGDTLVFAMNAGIFMENRLPLGLYVENGRQARHLITRTTGYGNFYMQPNGVFGLADTGPFIIKTAGYKDFARRNRVQFATQSGPLLVMNGRGNPSFQPGSQARTIRNGVCLTRDRNVILSISLDPVSFHEMAQHFVERLQCQDALYMDGGISAAYRRGSGLPTGSDDFGPLIGVTTKRP